ncbi:MAG TPA: cobalt transporter CbiM [Bryobacteraceae bacterium]|nr:cobalt transporter CbiM [Bryobacteraceae bacterium]
MLLLSGALCLHIPDGYLSPSTCGTLLAAAAPFWYIALIRVQKILSTRMIPLVSVFAAFSFVIMMFNLPLPGGTTGHAVGMGVASIVLGPWASILAISTALVIQAVFFGDGGITAIGANCFNMAIMGSLVAFGVYRLAGYRAAIGSTRRVLGAGIAGYAAINIAALLAAIEFGLQPVFFHDASGAPLYAPYPLRISVPAMMIGHLTFAGLAEFLISAGIIAYLQKADPALLRLTAPEAPDSSEPLPAAPAMPQSTVRKLWLGLAVLLILTPLGILAAGNAWGEWTARDFSDPQARQQIAAVSGHQAPPKHVPQGLERLSSIWTAPLSRYAPSFIRSVSFGYFVSAMVGVGLIILGGVVINWLSTTAKPRPRPGQARYGWAPSGRHRRKSFVERTVRSLLEAMEQTLFAEDMAATDGFLQRLDPRVKLIGISALILAAVAVRRLPALAGVLLAGFILALLSRVPIRVLATRVWLAVAAFTGAIALPAIFLTPGRTLYRLPVLDWQITQQGLHASALLILRAETAATLSVLLILSTLWTHLLQALRSFRLPVVLVVILGMTYRYMFLFLQIARDMFESRECRLVGILEPADRRRLAAASAGVLLGKTLQLSGEVHTAMQARGFRGEVRLLNEWKMGWGDWIRAAGFVGIAAAALWWGR